VDNYEDIFAMCFAQAGNAISGRGKAGNDGKMVDVRYEKAAEIQTPLGS
jgi:hypothetical protein